MNRQSQLLGKRRAFTSFLKIILILLVVLLITEKEVLRAEGPDKKATFNWIVKNLSKTKIVTMTGHGLSSVRPLRQKLATLWLGKGIIDSYAFNWDGNCTITSSMVGRARGDRIKLVLTYDFSIMPEFADTLYQDGSQTVVVSAYNAHDESQNGTACEINVRSNSHQGADSHHFCDMVFRTSELANRGRKAIEHAMSICRDSDDLFK